MKGSAPTQGGRGGVTVSVSRRQFDRRAVVLGGVAEALVVMVPAALGKWYLIALLGPVVAGLIAGWTSRSFEHEGNDGGVAAFLGAVLALVGVGLLIWFTNPQLPVDLKIDLVLFATIFGAFGVLAFGFAFGVVGALVATVTAMARRRSAYVPDRG